MLPVSYLQVHHLWKLFCLLFFIYEAVPCPPLSPPQPTGCTSWGRTHDTASGSSSISSCELKTALFQCPDFWDCYSVIPILHQSSSSLSLFLFSPVCLLSHTSLHPLWGNYPFFSVSSTSCSPLKLSLVLIKFSFFIFKMKLFLDSVSPCSCCLDVLIPSLLMTWKTVALWPDASPTLLKISSNPHLCPPMYYSQ